MQLITNVLQVTRNILQHNCGQGVEKIIIPTNFLKRFVEEGSFCQIYTFISVEIIIYFFLHPSITVIRHIN